MCNFFNLLCNIFSVFYLYLILALFILSLNYFAHFSFYFRLTFTCCHALLIIFAWKRRAINFKLSLLLLLTSFIMCNGSLGRHGNSLGIQIFLTYLTKSEANALVPDKFK